MALLAAKEKDGGGAGSSVQGRLLGEHPDGGQITVRQGRFGPYVNRGKINATLKRDMSPESLTLEEAIRLVEDKEGAGGGAKKKVATKAPAVKKTLAKKQAAKKPAMKAKKA